MASLSATVHKEFSRILFRSQLGFSTIPSVLQDAKVSYESKKAFNQLTKRTETLLEAANEWSQQEVKATQRPGSASLQEVAGLRHRYGKFEMLLPSEKEIETINKLFDEYLESTPVGKTLRQAYHMSPFNAVRGALATIGCLSGGAVFSAAEYAVATFSSIAYRTTGNHKFALGMGLGALAGEVAYLIHSRTTYDVTQAPYPWVVIGANMMVIGMSLSSIPAVLSGPSRFFMGAKKHLMKSARNSFNGAVRLEVAIEEATRSSRALRKVEQKLGHIPEEIEGYAVRLDQVLTGYLLGTHTHTDIENARIRYTLPRTSPVPSLPQAPQPIPVTTVSYQESKQREAERTAYEQRKRRKNGNITAEEREVAVAVEERRIRVELSAKLERAYKSRRSRVGNYSLQPVVDLACQKIEQNPQGLIIRRTTDGKYLVDSLIRRHGLPPDTTIHKIAPTGSLRALYVLDGTKAKLLEVLTHDEYDRRLDK